MSKPEDKSILVVDDEPDVQLFLSSTLADAGFHVVTASNGLDAYNRLKESIPALITLDLVMPRQSGVVFYKRVRKNPKYLHIPVLIVTAHAHDDLGQEDFGDIMKGIDAPTPDGFLEKPVQPTELVRKVGELTGADVSAYVNDATEDARSSVLDKLRGADAATLTEVQALLASKRQPKDTGNCG
ncbi:MAG: response regulator [Polyangiaceae bacterium]|nr:response regulator [Polyangiaceae bacterium]